MARSYLWNAFEQALAGSVTSLANTITLDSVVGLRAPGYVVIDKADAAKREYVYYTGISGSDLTGVSRGLGGSAGGAQSHDSGKLVHSVWPHQVLDDAWDDIGGNTADIATNAADIATNVADIATNAADISLNSTDITNNSQAIVTNAADIVTNQGNIATNTSDIATNAAGIAAIPSTIQELMAQWQSTYDAGPYTVGLDDWVNVEIQKSANFIPTAWGTYTIEYWCQGTVRKNTGTGVGSHVDVRLSVLGDDGWGTLVVPVQLHNLLNQMGENDRIPFSLFGWQAVCTEALISQPSMLLQARSSANGEQFLFTDLQYNMRAWKLT